MTGAQEMGLRAGGFSGVRPRRRWLPGLHAPGHDQLRLFEHFKKDLAPNCENSANRSARRNTLRRNTLRKAARHE
jgi:hypothetical protein